jgi:Fic family protein
VKRALIEAVWKRNPAATIEQVRRATGAPSSTVRFVFGQLRAAGKLAPIKNRAERDLLKAV